jgi:hypothetical protein
MNSRYRSRPKSPAKRPSDYPPTTKQTGTTESPKNTQAEAVGESDDASLADS